MTVDKVIAKIIWITFFWPTLYAIARPSVRHMGGSVKKRLKLGSCNFHHRVAKSL